MQQSRLSVVLNPSLSTQGSTFNLEDLKAFNPGLVYGFVPEASPQKYERESAECILNSTGQYQDRLDAYLYAQKEILPLTRGEKIGSLTSEQFITMLKQIHQQIARTLAREYKATAGEFTTQQIVRWKYATETANVGTIQILYFSPARAKDLNLREEAKKLNCSHTALRDFFALLEKLEADPSVSLPVDYKPATVPENERAKQLFTKLIVAFHTGKLTEGELAIVNKIVKIFPLPTKIPKMMQEFAEQLLAKWRDCKPYDVEAAANLAQFAFYGVTEIHPFFIFNGNDTLAPCLINIILRSLGHPSILLCYPDEQDDPASFYSRAIKNIHKPSLLREHIKQRIQGEKYENPARAELISTRVQLGHIFDKLKNYYSLEALTKQCNLQKSSLEKEASHFTSYLAPMVETDPNAVIPTSHPLYQRYYFFMKQYHESPAEVNSPAAMLQQVQLLIIRRLIEYFSKILAKKISLSEEKKTSVSLGVVQRQYSFDEKLAIKTQLADITGMEGWKTFNDKGSTVFLSPSFDSKSAAETIATQLQFTGAKIELKFLEKQYVIKLSALSPQKLAAGLSNKTVPLEKTTGTGMERKLITP